MARRGRGLQRPEEESSADAGVALSATGAQVDRVLAGLPPDDRTLWARDITQRIVQRVAELHLLIEEAHAGKAHLWLGYSRWDDYVKDHFNIGRKQAHNYLLQGRVIRTLESASNGATVSLAPSLAKHVYPVLDEAVEALRRFIEAGHDPEWAVEAIINYYGRPTKREAIALAAVEGARGPMTLQLVETGALAEIEPDPAAHRDAVLDLMDATKAAVPHPDWLAGLNYAERKRLRNEIAKAEKWLAVLQTRLDELPPGPPMPPPPYPSSPHAASGPQGATCAVRSVRRGVGPRVHPSGHGPRAGSTERPSRRGVSSASTLLTGRPADCHGAVTIPKNGRG